MRPRRMIVPPRMRKRRCDSPFDDETEATPAWPHEDLGNSLSIAIMATLGRTGGVAAVPLRVRGEHVARAELTPQCADCRMQRIASWELASLQARR
jgi:hypothetical protein